MGLDKKRNIYGGLEEFERFSERDEFLERNRERFTKDIPFKQSQINKIWDRLKLEERKVMGELMGEIQLLETHKQNIRELRKTIKRIHYYMKKGFSDIKGKDSKVTIDKKVKKGNEYIRGRIYWDGGSDGKGGLREIHGMYSRIGKLVDEINECIRNGEEGFPKRELKDIYKSKSWDEIKDDKKILNLLEILGRKKFRKQLLEQFLSRRTLGYRIRKKDMVSIHKTKEGKKGKDKPTLFSKKYYRDMYFDKTTLNQKTKPNHFYDYMLEILIEENEDRKESHWYKNCVEWLKKEGRWK